VRVLLAGVGGLEKAGEEGGRRKGRGGGETVTVGVEDGTLELHLRGREWVVRREGEAGSEIAS